MNNLIRLYLLCYIFACNTKMKWKICSVLSALDFKLKKCIKMGMITLWKNSFVEFLKLSKIVL